MKRFIRIFLIIAILACVLLPTLTACNAAGGSGGTDTLVIYNWEDYIDLSLRKEFEDYYYQVTGRRLSITYTTYDTNETMMTKMLKGDANVDLICPSEYSIEKLLLAGLLENHNDLLADVQSQLAEIEQLHGENYEAMLEETGFDPTFGGMSSLGSGYGTIEPAVMDVIDNMFSAIEAEDGNVYDMTEYMVPYMYGTLGILYNKNIISQEELDTYGWGVLWNVQKNPDLENKILMKDSVRDTYAAALFYMYEYNLLPEQYKDIDNAQDLINITDPEMLAAAEAVLTEQRDHITGYEVDFGKDDMLNEIVYADFAWSGDALWAVEESYLEDEDDYYLGYYCPTGINPETGKQRFSNIWYDGWCIPTTVNNKLAALMFIDYMCRPESAIRNSIEIGYTCAVDKDLLENSDEVCEILEDNEYDVEEYFSNEGASTGRFPEIDSSLGVMRDFGSRNEDVVNMWQRAKSGSGIDLSLLYIILVIVGAVGIAIGIYFLIQYLKRRPRKL